MSKSAWSALRRPGLPSRLASVPSTPSGASQSSSFQAGSSGLLQTGNGQSFNLGSGSGGIQSQVTHKVCDMVLQHAKSLL